MIDFKNETPKYIQYDKIIYTFYGKNCFAKNYNYSEISITYYIEQNIIIKSDSIQNIRKSEITIPSEKDVYDFNLNELNKKLEATNCLKLELEKQIEELKQKEPKCH